MNQYETSTTVGGQGEIHLAGVPFSPGTEVEVVVSAKMPAAEKTSEASDRLMPLLAALDQAHNAQPIGPLNRDELYDRDHVH